jgi:hypothetical protein
MLGVAIHLPIVMVVLMLRSQHRRENTRRIQGLYRVDPATGRLDQWHVFAERLTRMIARSGTAEASKAPWMLIDLVNSDQDPVRDFTAAEDLLLRVAEALSTAREIDSAVRPSERFGIAG